MTNKRAYERFLAVLSLARRPGTPEEGEAAWEMAKKLSAKYGFSLNDGAQVTEAQREEAKRVVRKWRQYQGREKKAMRNIFKIAKSVGYIVDGDKIYASVDEMVVLLEALAIYKKGSVSARNYHKNRIGGSFGFSVYWDNALVKYLRGEDMAYDQFEAKCLDEIYKVAAYLRRSKA